jgi:hypothetical protein
MKRVFLILSIAALALPATALGKGPSEALISGPGAGGGDGGSITLRGDLSPSSPLMKLAEQAGFFPAVFRQEPGPMLASRPRGELGPKYSITYTVPGPNTEPWKIRQDAYPYAKSGPVTYMEPGQKVFEIVGGTRGGWFRADARLKETLVAVGRPARASGASSESSSSFRIGLVGLLAAALLLAAATAVVLRRRARQAPAA